MSGERRGRPRHRSPRTCLAIVAVLVAATIITAFGSADAQEPGKTARIGSLGPRSRADGAPFLEAFRQGLRELGWVEGKNLVIEYRWAEGNVDRIAEHAGELVRLKVDVILAANTQAAVAAKNATTTIPIVMGTSGDPVAVGLVASLGRPGGNVTGLAWSAGVGTFTKELQLLKETVPSIRRVAVLLQPANPAHVLWRKDGPSVARALDVQLHFQEARGPEHLDRAFAAMARERADSLLVLTDSVFALHRARVQDLAARQRLPAMYGAREYTEAGGLMSYGPDVLANFRRAATYVDRILKGAKPADLPVEQGVKLELIINDRTARALGIKIPPSVLLRADEVIE